MSVAVGTRTLEQLESSRRYNEWLYERVVAAVGSRVLEIGCGTGTFTQFLVDRELVVGVDVDPAHLELARGRFRDHSNVLIMDQDISATADGLHEYGFDSVVSVNVLEHIADDRAALRAARSLLVPGGTIALVVPAHRFLMSPFDRALGHHRRYTKGELRDKLSAAGFSRVVVRYSNPVGAVGWFANNVVLRRSGLSAVKLYDRLVPSLAWIDRRIEFPLGLSVVARAQRPRS